MKCSPCNPFELHPLISMGAAFVASSRSVLSIIYLPFTIYKKARVPEIQTYMLPLCLICAPFTWGQMPNLTPEHLCSSTQGTPANYTNHIFEIEIGGAEYRAKIEDTWPRLPPSTRNKWTSHFLVGLTY